MVQSPEYPDLKWVPPKAFGVGRDGKAVRYIVIHYTAGAERSTSAEDGAAYDQRRTNGVSTHYFVDSNSVVQCVLTKNRANSAYHRGNRLGIQYELCGTVQTRTQWLDTASLPTLRNAARQVARDCRKYNIPVRRLTVAETRRAWTEFPNGPRGIVGHVDCTHAYPEDGGDHTDPGTNFPWDQFLSMVRDEMEDDMPSAEEIAKAVWDHREVDPADAEQVAGKKPPALRMGGWARYEKLRADNRHNTVINKVLAALGQDTVDEQEIVNGVLSGITPERLAAGLQAAGMSPAAVAAAIPAAVAAQVVDELSARIAAQRSST